MRLYLALACLLLATTPIQAQTRHGDAAAGKALALRNCASCHVVAEQQPRPATDGVPPFATLARNPALTEQRLRTFLQTPHPPMPDLSLAREEIDDLASYILSLRN